MPPTNRPTKIIPGRRVEPAIARVPPVSPGDFTPLVGVGRALPAAPPVLQIHPKQISKAEIAALIGNVPNPVLLEIGCNDGTDSLELAEISPKGRLACFEPDPRPIVRFEHRFAGYPNHDQTWFLPHETQVRLYQMAIGDQNGTAIFHQSSGHTPTMHVDDWDLSGSLYQPTGHLKKSPEIKFARQIEVQVRTLDAWANEEHDWIQGHKRVDFIWADTQGAEAALIRGGRATLSRTRYLYSEFYPTPMYAGQPNLDEIRALLGSNWAILGIYDSHNFLARNLRFT